MQAPLKKKHGTSIMHKLLAGLTRLLNFLSERAADDTALRVGASDWKPTVRLPEDTELIGFTALSEGPHFQDTSCPDLAVQQCARVERVLHLGRKIAALSLFEMNFDQDTVTFSSTNQEQYAPSPTKSGSFKDQGQLQREQQSRAMAQRFLESEVAKLESDVKSRQHQSQQSPLIVPDAQTLANHLRLLKELVASEHFVAHIASCTLGGLDRLKQGTQRVNQGAREAIRFLSEHVKTGHPAVRYQQPHESWQLPVMEGCSRDTIQLLAYAAHIAFQQCPRPNLVTVLTSDGEVTQQAQSLGLQVTTLTDFHRHCKRAR